MIYRNGMCLSYWLHLPVSPAANRGGRGGGVAIPPAAVTLKNPVLRLNANVNVVLRFTSSLL